MRNKIMGGIGIIWGGVILLRALFGSSEPSAGAYKAGQTGGLMFGVLLLVVGLYYFFKAAPKKA
jgi:hypothetical protein